MEAIEVSSKKSKGTVEEIEVKGKKSKGKVEAIEVKSKKSKGTVEEIEVKGKKSKGKVDAIEVKSKKSKGKQETCASRFTAPPKPKSYKATEHNGVKLADVCYTGKGPFHVFIIGDWGGKKDPNNGKIAAVSHLTHRWNTTENFRYIWPTDQDCQWLVANEMRKRAPKSRPDYVLNMGDNFYWGGVEDYCTGDMFRPYSTGGSPVYKKDHVDQFKEIFEDVYYGKGIDGIQWLGVLGNHDYGGWRFDMAWDQAVGYTWSESKTSKGRWMTPALYYRVTVKYPDFSIDYWFMDTNVFDALPYGEKPPHNICGPHNEGASTCTKSGGPKSLDDCQGWFHRLWAEQKKWLDKTVPESKAEWRIIVTHFPPYWGKKDWMELAPKHEIDVIITGHRHSQSMHCKDDVVAKIWGESQTSTEMNDFLDPTAWIVSGGGGGITSEHIPDPAGNDDQYGFVDMTVTKKELTFEALSHKGMLRKTMVVKHSYSHGGINEVPGQSTTPKPETTTEAKKTTKKSTTKHSERRHEERIAA